MVLQKNKLESPSSKDALCQVWLILAQWFWRRGFFNLSIYSLYFVIISPWKRVGPFIWTNLNPLHPRIIYAMFSWNWPSGYGEEDFLNLSMYFHNSVIISTWKRAWPFIWSNLNPLHIRINSCQVWLKLAHWFWRRRSKCEKFKTMKTKTTTMTTTDNGQILIRKAHLSLRFRWAKNAPFIITCLTTLSLEIAIVHTHQICSSDIHKKFSFIHAVLW